jgi:hypothetical protein
LVPILTAKGSARMEFIGSMMDLASGTAREPVTKSFCMSTTTSAGTKLSDAFRAARFVIGPVIPGIIKGIIEIYRRIETVDCMFQNMLLLLCNRAFLEHTRSGEDSSRDFQIRPWIIQIW